MTRVRTDPLAWTADALEEIRELGLERVPLHLASAPGPEVVLDGRRLVHLCSNDYLGLATDPRVTDAAAKAAKDFGAGAGASRLVSGGTSLHRRLEEALAEFKGTDDCVLFSSGYLANTGTIPALVEAGDEVLSDALNHASVVDACRLSRAKIRVYRHTDVGHLEALLAESGARRKLVVTDTVFSMDGDVAPLAPIAEACDRHGAMLMVDEAHATGVVGPGGRGALHAAGVRPEGVLVMGTLSKALGSQGGFICGPSDAIALLRNRARTFIFDTAVAPPAVAAALAALELLQAEPRAERTRFNARRLAAAVRSSGIPVPDPAAAIVPVVIGDPRRAVAVADRLREHGVLAPAIRPPSIPEGTSRIRLTAMATHTDEHLAQAETALKAALT